MQIEHTPLQGCFIIKPDVFYDDRGYFVETYNDNKFQTFAGFTTHFVQDNESCSSYGVVRGLHFQKNKFAQTKLVRVVQGKIIDVVVDIRKESTTFLQHFSIELNDVNKYQLYIPIGFAHGFAVLTDNTIVNYKCDNLYNKQAEGGLNLNDTTLNIDWQIPVQQRIISLKDTALPNSHQLDFNNLFD